MIDGRSVMLNSVNNELEYLESMRLSVDETIEIQQNLIAMNQTKLREANELMERFKKRTDMCFQLKESLEDFQTGLDALADSQDKGGKK